jgi:hypothetical protein
MRCPLSADFVAEVGDDAARGGRRELLEVAACSPP